MNETRLILPTQSQLEAHVLELQDELQTARQMLTVAKRLAKQRQDRPLEKFWEQTERTPEPAESLEPAFTTAPPQPDPTALRKRVPRVPDLPY